MNNSFEDIATLIKRDELEKAHTQLKDLRGDAEELRVERMYLEARILERRGDWKASVAKLREILEIDEDHSETLFRLAYLVDLHGDDEEAMQLYERCVQDPPSHVNALMNLAVLYEDHGRFEDACEVLKSVVAHCPNHLRARLFLKDIESSLTMYYDEDREANQEKHDAILDTPISDFELSVRSRNCLKQMDINTLGDLLQVTEQKLLMYKNFGETSLNEIKAMLDLKGLHLGQILEERPPATPAAPIGVAGIQAGEPNLLNRSVAELELSVRSRKCLQRLGISTLGELVQRSEPELLSIKNFGQTSLVEIKRRLGELGIALREAVL